MRDLLAPRSTTRPGGETDVPAGSAPSWRSPGGCAPTPTFAKRWAGRLGGDRRGHPGPAAPASATPGVLRDDVPLDVLAQFLELAYDGLVLHLAMGRPAGDLGPVLDLVEEAVRRR